MLIFSCSIISAQTKSNAPKFTISGYIKDSSNGESLIGSTIYIKELKTGGATNEYGYYILSVPSGSFTLVYSFMGFKTKEITFNVKQNIKQNVLLKESNIETKEVVVTGERSDRNFKSTEMSRMEISGEKVKSLPVIFGEPDVLKAITLLPGIKSGGEGSTGFYVRGGGPDQNLVMMDEAVVYNPAHLLGFMSVFNTDAVKNIEIIKGGMPANYGGRLSSILNVSMKDGDNQKYVFSGGVGLIASRFSAEGPIKKNKSSFIVSARRTYIDALVQPFLASQYKGNGYYFYDLNAKANYIFSDKDRLYFSFYLGRDVFNFTSPVNSAINFNITWGNTAATIRWNHIFSDKLFSNTSIVYNRYDLNNQFTFGTGVSQAQFMSSSGIQDWTLKSDYQYHLSNKHHFKFGGQYIFHTFQPGIASGTIGTVNFGEKIQNKYAHELNLYAMDEWQITNRLSVNTGLRWVLFDNVGPYTQYQFDENNLKTGVSQSWGTNESVALYTGFEPRFAATYLVTDHSSVKASFTKTYQFLNLATTSGASFPSDLWIPSTQTIKPQMCLQYALGYYHNFDDNAWESSIETYYKPMYNQIEFKPGTQLFLNQNLDAAVIQGQGLSYGIEFFLKKKVGKTTGWFGYTLSKTTRQFDELNNGKEFYYRYDRTHDLSLVITHQISKKWSGTVVFVYGTGNAATLPTGRYAYRIGYDQIKNQPKFAIIDYYDQLNSYRLPAYHRMDVSFTYMHKKTAKWESSWNFSVYNVYNRANPYFIYFVPDVLTQTVKAYMVYLFPILPSVAWNFKF
jgi:outer membrane receptor for ferrienterochelin and colicin